MGEIEKKHKTADKCEKLSFSKIQKLKAEDLRTCKKSVQQDLAACRKNVNKVRRHTVRGGDTLARILGTQVFYNKRIYLNKKNLGFQPEYKLKLGDMLSIKGNACSDKIEITLKRDPILKIAIEVGKRVYELPKKDLQIAQQTIPKISEGIFSYAEIMALAAKESRMVSTLKDGLTQFLPQFRPKSDERKLSGAASIQKGVLRDLEDTTIHLTKYYKGLEGLYNNPQNKQIRASVKKYHLTMKELAITAYNRGYQNVINILAKGKDPRVAGLPSYHKYYARDILRLAMNDTFLKILKKK